MTRSVAEVGNVPRCTTFECWIAEPLVGAAASWRRIDTDQVVKVQQHWPRRCILSRYEDSAEGRRLRSGVLPVGLLQCTPKSH